ncbi:MAG: glucose-6-phosphate isomerase, partial [Acidobacteria bacterium]|nr:glucose-6-phosphate isomerase [Acidobacteriota bacterium]
ALKEGTKKTLQETGFLVSELTIKRASEESISQAMTFFILTTLMTADLLKVNPFSQEGVEEGKKITKSLLS